MKIQVKTASCPPGRSLSCKVILKCIQLVTEIYFGAYQISISEQISTDRVRNFAKISDVQIRFPLRR